MSPADELRHIQEGVRPSDVPGGAGLRVLRAISSTSGEDVLVRCRAVLTPVVAAQAVQDWPAEAEWEQRLPTWFVAACSTQTQEEVDDWFARWEALPYPERVAVEVARPWSLRDWLHWHEPEERVWAWWDAQAGAKDVVFALEVEVDPAPLGAFWWMVRAAGGTEPD